MKDRTFSFPSDFELPYDWDRHCPDNYVFEHAPGAVEDVHGDDIDTALGVVEDLCDVPIIGYWIALEDVALQDIFSMPSQKLTERSYEYGGN